MPSSKSASRSSRARWWHSFQEQRPPEFAFGPLTGAQLDLAQWICPCWGYKPDIRALQRLGEMGDVWIIKAPHHRPCRVFFREQHLYSEANARRLRQKEQEEALRMQ